MSGGRGNGRRRRDRGADVIGGWLLGHQIARGHGGFPGDPLPGGHLGSPADLAFWGGVLGDDADEDDADDTDDEDDVDDTDDPDDPDDPGDADDDTYDDGV